MAKHNTPAPTETVTPAETHRPVLSHRNATISKLTFAMPVLYAAGPIVLTPGEAAALNQTHTENLRNNNAAWVLEQVAAGRPHEEIAEELVAKFAAYRFGQPGTRGPSTAADPIGAEVTRLAKADILAALKAKGVKLPKEKPLEATFTIKGQIISVAQLIEAKANANRADYTARAEAIVAARKAPGTGGELDDLIAD